jgi:hypothetical protein
MKAGSNPMSRVPEPRTNQAEERYQLIRGGLTRASPIMNTYAPEKGEKRII